MPADIASPLDVLVIAAAANSARSLENALLTAGRTRVTTTTTLTEALSLLPGQVFDALVLDFGPPGSYGPATIRHLSQAAPNSALVVVGGKDDADHAVAAVKAGAQDYLPRGWDSGGAIIRAVSLAIVRKRAECRLEVARRDAVEANLRKSDFLASMSHELRTPLNVVLGYAEVLKDEMLGPSGVPKYKDYAGHVFEAGTFLLALINDVLDLSKIESGRFRLIEEETDPAQIVASCLDLMENVFRSRRLAVDRALPIALPWLRCDVRLVQQVLFNLLSNAAKFTPDGGRLTVGAMLAADGGVTIEVSDSGIGIPAEAIRRVMENYEQADLTTAREFGGTGLGLPLARRLMELHGGTLELLSTAGVGTTATISFPVERTIAPVRPRGEGSVAPFSGGGTRPLATSIRGRTGS